MKSNNLLLYSLERMSLIGLLHSLQHRLVDPEADGGRERCQGQVRPDADHAELGQGEEEQEHAAEHGPWLLHIPPVEEVNRWKGRTEEGETGLGPGVTWPATKRPGYPQKYLFLSGFCALHTTHLGQISGSSSQLDVLRDPQLSRDPDLTQLPNLAFHSVISSCERGDKWQFVSSVTLLLYIERPLKKIIADSPLSSKWCLPPLQHSGKERPLIYVWRVLMVGGIWSGLKHIQTAMQPGRRNYYTRVTTAELMIDL